MNQWDTPSLITLDSLRMLMSSSLSRMLPWDSNSSFRMRSSIAFSWFLSALIFTINWFLCSSKSGLSSPTTSLQGEINPCQQKSRQELQESRSWGNNIKLMCGVGLNQLLFTIIFTPQKNIWNISKCSNVPKICCFWCTIIIPSRTVQSTPKILLWVVTSQFLHQNIHVLSKSFDSYMELSNITYTHL